MLSGQCIGRDRFQYLLKCLAFLDHRTLRKDVLTDRFAKFRWMLTSFEDSARKWYKPTELVCLETLRNFFSANSCDFLVFLKGKPGQIGMFFYTLGDGIDRYFIRIIPKVKTVSTQLVMDICSDILDTGRNLTADSGLAEIERTLEQCKEIEWVSRQQQNAQKYGNFQQLIFTGKRDRQ